LNKPTKLTLLRIALIPVLLVLNYLALPHGAWVLLAVFLAASATDWLDGYLARKHNQTTTLGKLLDPLADKLLVLSAFLILLEQRALPAWMAILMIGREMAITGLRAYLAAERVILPAGRLGKWKMTFQVISLSFLFVATVHPVFHWTGKITVLIALVLSLLSASFYVRDFWKLLGGKIMAEQSAGRQG
jgi:CDP-diacylglycerol--glycerol-3-phosphate 3-phosphatidyltransferase